MPERARPFPADLAAWRSASEDERAAARKGVRVLVLEGLGLNCEVETEVAFRLVGASPERVHLLDLLEGDAGRRRLAETDVVAFVGGFSFGDHLGAGTVFANKIRWRLLDALHELVERGGLALGICNGFQTLVRLGMLPGLDGESGTPRCALAPNERVGYRDAWVRLGVDPRSPCVWTRGLERLELPSRHGEGRLIHESDALREQLDTEHLVPLRYADAAWEPTTRWPDNPNGSAGGAAGLCDPSGRVFGLMPHPDAFLYPFQHPEWPRWKAAGTVPEEGGGLAIFRGGVDHVAARRG